ncbi:hypothetical protein PUV47_17080 [Pseudovibrio exalbescens]|uniref:hypothetical protein n=1 Tax=Pseudovibrio exalbescens TaxID=197461 RepID=UPI002365A59C|nr:hypothetical protein [Pseudovibrio exalbescens]MDD7911648.1 hypothetical protein [Pseudovibrio exalbescens]
MITDDIEVIDYSNSVEHLLAPFAGVLGQDYDGYRGHIYRNLTYTLHFLDGDETFRPEIEAALVYHHIGLWTHATLHYVKPSLERFGRDSRRFGWDLDNILVWDIIQWHHKLFWYRGPNADVINAVRKADWVDASGGRIRKGLSSEQVRLVRDAIPEAGFQKALRRMSRELKGGNWANDLIWMCLKVQKL